MLQVSWQRVRVANALASSGEEWTNYLKYHNSGTYNNQCALSYSILTNNTDLSINSLS